jgi:hypothetical protein
MVVALHARPISAASDGLTRGHPRGLRNSLSASHRLEAPLAQSRLRGLGVGRGDPDPAPPKLLGRNTSSALLVKKTS